MGAPDPIHGTGDSAATETMSTIGVGPAAKPTHAPGEMLADRFKIIRYIARGGMGEVYEAADLQLQGKRLALKILLPKTSEDPAARQRFEREVLLAREIHHPNVCPTYDLFRGEGASGKYLFLTMKLLAGETLSAVLKRRGPMTPEAALPLLRQMAAGLDAAHAAGVVHRDFKPGNVIVDSTQQPPGAAITDFGISRLFSSGVTITNHIAGTPGFIAPEIFKGGNPTPASDVYAFGVVIRELVAHPSKAWEQVILKCLDPDPGQRPKSAGSAVALLKPESTSPFLLRRRVFVWGIPSAAGAAASAGLWFGRPAIDAFLHPLPQRRLVALMPWPAGGDPQSRGLLRNVLDTIESRLTQAEASSHDFLIISSADPRNPVSPGSPAEAGGSLGANLVLAGSLSTTPSTYELDLQVLDAATSRALRSGKVKTPGSAIGNLIERACAMAGNLLNVPVVHAASSEEDELASIPPAALQAFAKAEDLVARPNDAGLDEAIEQYQKALELRQTFALGYAQLSRAYTRKFRLTHNAAELSLARRNADLARKYNPASEKAQFSSALVLLFGGETAEAVEVLSALLRADPTNAQYAQYKGYALRNLGRRSEEQAVYREILQSRPNYWPAYNELGWALYRDGRNDEAAKAFAEASAVAPKVALPLANLGSIYLVLDRKKDAADAFRRSLELAPNSVAYNNLGSLDFENRDYRKALENYNKARDLNPKDDGAWRNIADCETMLGNVTGAHAAYGKAAEISSEQVKLNPKLGRSWMTLAYYRAKSGDRAGADAALLNAEQNGASDVASQFLKAQTLAATGREEESLTLILRLLEGGLSPVEVELSLDLGGVRADTRYKKAIEGKKR
jgi:serine/threonine protein kinase/tetratricopeptide (TPR) repeat protein